jgi:hypothetical protein
VLQARGFIAIILGELSQSYGQRNSFRMVRASDRGVFDTPQERVWALEKRTHMDPTRLFGSHKASEG